MWLRMWHIVTVTACGSVWQRMAACGSVRQWMAVCDHMRLVHLHAVLLEHLGRAGERGRHASADTLLDDDGTEELGLYAVRRGAHVEDCVHLLHPLHGDGITR